MTEGILLINKPGGWTSHDIVAKVRRKLGTKKVGHAGTLDPLATGLLVILVGRSTKLFEKFVNFDKAYRSTLILGTSTTSADIQGEIIEQKPFDYIRPDDIQSAFKSFVGEFDQVPPMVSAVKHKGQKLYQLARKGIEVERKARRVRVDTLDIEKISIPEVQFYMECSKGTYVRQLAADIGERLGCGACISRIERTKVGRFRVEDAVRIEDLHESHLRHWQA